MKLKTEVLILPKITHRSIQDLISRNKKQPYINEKDIRKSFSKNNKQNYSHHRNNRYTDFDINHENMNSFQIKSPFYQKLHLNNSEKCPCQYHRLEKKLRIPKIRKTQGSYQNVFALHKIDQIKKYHQNLVLNTKINHNKNHEMIDINEQKYILHYLQKSVGSKQQKLDSILKNHDYYAKKIQKTINQKNKNKQFKRIFFKQKLQKVYNLDNENDPFQKMLEKRNQWEKDKRIWGVRILKFLHHKIKQCKKFQIEILKEKQNKQNRDQLSKSKQTQNVLLSEQKCLPMIMNNISSIEELRNIESKQNQTIKQKLSEVFVKSLKLQSKSHGEVLVIELSKLFEHMILEDQESKKAKARQKQLARLNKIFQNKNHNSVDDANILSYIKDQIKGKNNNLQEDYPEGQTIQKDLFKNNKIQSILISSSLQKSKQGQQGFFQQNKKHQNLNEQKKNSQSNFSSTNLSKKLTKLSKMTSISNAFSRNSNLTKRKDQIEDQKLTFSKIINIQSTNSPKQSKNASKVMIDNSIPIIEQLFFAKKSQNCSFNATPSLSKHIISQQQELKLQEEQKQTIQNQQMKNEKQKQKQIDQQESKHHSKKSSQQVSQQLQREQQERVYYIIEFLKSKKFLRKGKQIVIPSKYQHIKYQKFCSKITFEYIASLVDGYQGQTKYKFLYSQLQLKNKVLQDDYIQQVVKQFKLMFSEEEDFQAWKGYLFENRNKMILARLNRMIDLGNKQIQKNQLDPLLDLQNELEQNRAEQHMMFRKFDQSQAAYERYLQKIERRKQIQSHSILMIQRDINELEKTKDKAKGSQPITQKSILSQIQENQNKEILYSVKQNQPEEAINESVKSNKKQVTNLNDKQNQKKVLKYLLKKKPRQFDLLNKEISNFSQLINNSFSILHNEEDRLR